MIAGTGFFWFSDLKFQAEMGLLLTLLMTFNKFGGLIVVPALRQGAPARRSCSNRVPRAVPAAGGALAAGNVTHG